ncbi:PAS domain S-box protein [Azospirillum brasilense]|uniref:histidine kinase n=1 Tax=Azospirillum brasilense TaxID=192 RepID=A0A0P0F799_AZOBR|nr:MULTISPECIES: PAS domain-containing sensor histidine kinase [Azospirillum]ALJ36804.1 histidine kinase [Azospirillum brasilense]MDW7555897.1 ATP-binding protein [Azospirillum brasilense]MDW7595974.1 ATP-binding protein [Azospirillum brasilense]MDW7630979.1 ATP-binding protein [Azospirillum brasilense]MDX5951585.1 ATP-binding protein [Azospirillum brasilense]
MDATPPSTDRTDAAEPLRRRRGARAGIVLRISIGLTIMTMLVLLVGVVSLSSFQLFRGEVSVLSTTTLPKVITSAELRGSLQKLVARLPVLAGAATTPQRRAIYDELISELEFLRKLVERMHDLHQQGEPGGDGESDELRLLEQAQSTLLILAATVADLNAEVGRQIEAGARQAEAIRALAQLADALERLPGAEPGTAPTVAAPGEGGMLGAWAVRAGALMARAAGAMQTDHLNRLRVERRNAENTLAELGRLAAATPEPEGTAMERIRADLATILVAPGGLFDSSAERLQARNRAQALSGQSRVLVETVDRFTLALFDAIHDQSTDRTGDLAAMIQERSRMVMVLGGASILLAILVHLFFRRFLTSRLVALNGAVLARLSGSDATVPVEGNDEITDIAASIRYFIDEIDRRQMDLADNERRFRDLVEGSIQGIIIHRDFRPLYANDAFLQMFGSSLDRTLRVRSVLDFIAEDSRPLVEDNYRHIVATGLPSERRRLRARRLDGSERWIELTSRRIDWKGETAVQSIVVDVTREVEAEAALRRSRDAAEQALRELKETQASLIQAEKMASLGQLVAGVAHEVNTPIGITITGASQLALQFEELTRQLAAGAIKKSEFQRFLADGGEMARLILSNSTRAADLVQSFKMVAVDQSSDERRRFELRTYIGELLRSLRPVYKDVAGLDIGVDSPDELELDGYPGALSQILTNLVLNALTHAFTPHHPGRLTIAARLLPQDQVELTVADNGLGIPSDILPKIFDPFFTTRRGNGGSGLGLHIVYNLVTGTLRGTITAHSIPGEGTRFTLRFPRVTPTAGTTVGKAELV